MPEMTRRELERHNQDIVDWFGKARSVNRGQHLRTRRQKHPEVTRLYGWILDEHMLPDRPPDDVQAAFEELIGKEPNYRLALHPLYKRWTCFQRGTLFDVAKDGSKGPLIGKAWQPFYIAQEDPKPGELPQDYKAESQRHLWHLRGIMGEYRAPDRSDFELLMKFDINRLGVKQVNDNCDELDNELERDRAREKEARSHDAHSYYFNHFRDMANQDAGSGHRMSSVPTVEVRGNGDRYYVEEREGFRIRARRGTPLADRLEDAAAERKKAEESRLLSRIDRLIAEGSKRDLQQRARAAVQASKNRSL